MDYLDLNATKHIVLMADGHECARLDDERVVRRILNGLRKGTRVIGITKPNDSNVVVSFHLGQQNKHGWSHFDVAFDRKTRLLYRDFLGIVAPRDLEQRLLDAIR